MKRFLLILFVIFFSIQLFQTDKEIIKVDNDLEIQVPKEVMKIFKNSCYDCHSYKTSYPWYSYIAPFSWTIQNHIIEGRKALNFSTWQNYTKDEQDEKLKKIYKTVYASMPLKTYLWVHKEANLSYDERNLVRKWTKINN